MAWTATSSVTTTRAGLHTSASNESSTAAESHDPGLPHEHQYVLIALYTTTTLLAVTGNVIVLVVLAVGRRSRTDLRAFLINLAVADLTMAIFCMPFTFTSTMQHDWIFGAAMCTIVLFLQVSRLSCHLTLDPGLNVLTAAEGIEDRDLNEIGTISRS